MQDRLAGTVMAEDGDACAWPTRGLLAWAPSWPPPGPPVGDVVEPAADRPSAPERVSRRCIDEDLARGHLPSAVYPGAGGTAPRADGMPAHRAGAARAEGSLPWVAARSLSAPTS